MCFVQRWNKLRSTDAIPRMVVASDQGQLQTRDTFSFKWSKEETYNTPEFNEVYSAWLYQKYGFEFTRTRGRVFCVT